MRTSRQARRILPCMRFSRPRFGAPRFPWARGVLSRLALLALVMLPSLALSVELPSIDTPLKTGLSNKGDAAVVIGIEHYTYLPTAPYAERDAQAMYDFLFYTRGVPSSRITMLKGANNRKKIRDAVTEAGEMVWPGGTVWVYFAGHGAASPTTKERLLLPENTPADDEGYDESGVPVAGRVKFREGQYTRGFRSTARRPRGDGPASDALRLVVRTWPANSGDAPTSAA